MKQSDTISATILLSPAQIAQIIACVPYVDRHAAMVNKYGEVCTREEASRILHCSRATIYSMIKDGRIDEACEGRMVDVRSIADYIERRSEADRDARRRRRRYKSYV